MGIKLDLNVLTEAANNFFAECGNDMQILMEDGVPFKAFLFMEENSKAEIRRFGMDKVICGKIKPLMAKLRDVFPQLKTKNFTVSWKDEDEDEIIMSSDEEIVTMYHQSHEAVLKLFVRVTGPKSANDENPEITAAEANPAKTNPSSVHQGITCDGCGIPVVGFRYKCITCDDFDLCVQCENDGKHPEHCVVRVPIPNMPLPLIKATIKKSRRFLKSVASQAHEENKKLRRERSSLKHSSDGATNQGKPGSRRGGPYNWVSVFGSYLEEFTNLAGDYTRTAEKKPEPEATKPDNSAATENKVPTSDQISQNPWNLPQEDLEKLHHACKFMRDNALRDSLIPVTKAFNKVMEIVATAAEEALSPARASSPIREGPFGNINREMARQSQADQQKPVEVPKNVQDALVVLQQSMNDSCLRNQTVTNVNQEEPKVEKEVPKEPVASTSGQVQSTSESGKMAQISGENMAEFMNAVAAVKAGLSSNASSCSSGRGSDRAEGWTLINDHYDEVKDLMINTDEYSAESDVPESQERTDEARYFAPIYPPLNAATAVLDPNEADVAPVASAPPMPKTEAVQAPMANVAPTYKPAPATMPAPATKPTPVNAKPAPVNTKPAPVNTKPAPVNPKAAQAAEAIEATHILRSQLAPHVEAALRQMESMGFCNQSGWLTQLLYHHDGNISAVLDLLTPAVPHAK